MAMKPKIACTFKGCSNLVEPGNGGLCEVHQRKRHKDYQKSRGDRSVTKFYNTKAWQVARRAALMRDGGWCVMCGEKPAEVVDHIVEIKDGGCKTCLDNLQSLCAACHTKKTLAVAKDRVL